MKKKIIFAAVAAVVGVSGYGISNIASMQNNLTATQLLNVEALVRNEGGDRVPCHSSATQKYGKSYTDCSKCERIEDWEGTKTESRCTR